VRAEDEEADETREGKGRTGKRMAARHTRGTQQELYYLGYWVTVASCRACAGAPMRQFRAQRAQRAQVPYSMVTHPLAMLLETCE